MTEMLLSLEGGLEDETHAIRYDEATLRIDSPLISPLQFILRVAHEGGCSITVRHRCWDAIPERERKGEREREKEKERQRVRERELRGYT